MPSTCEWTGATDGDFATAGNWNPAVVPVAGDHLLFDTGNRDLDTGLNPAFAIGNITITKGYGGSIGPTSAFAPTGNISTIKGYLNRQCRIGSGGNVGTNIGDVNIQVGPGAKFIMATGTWALPTVTGGECKVEAAAVVTNMNLIRTFATILVNATAITLLNVDSATVVCFRVCTTISGNGTGRYEGQVSSGTASTTVNCNKGFVFNPRTGVTYTTVNLRDGSSLSLAGAKASATVTTLNRYAGAPYDASMGGVTLSIGTNNPIGFGSGTSDSVVAGPGV